MPSTLQVDKIIDGSATTNKELAEYSSSAWSWGAGVPVGSVLQTVNVVGTQQSGSGGAVIKYMEVSLTTKSANSDFLITCHMDYGSPSHSNNMDGYDTVFAFAYKLASAADSAYVGKLNNTNYNRKGFTGTAIGNQGWYCCDVPWTPNYSRHYQGKYDSFSRSFSGIDQTLSLASGTAINYALYVDVQDTYYLSQSRFNTANGGLSSLTVTEIKNV